MRRLLNMLLHFTESIGVFVLSTVLPFMVCLTIVLHSGHLLWSMSIVPISLVGFLIAVLGLHDKEGVCVYYRKEVLYRVIVLVAMAGLIGCLAYLSRFLAILSLTVLSVVYLILTEQLSRLCLFLIWRKNKVVAG